LSTPDDDLTDPGRVSPIKIRNFSSPNEPEYNELDIRIKISYKTLLLAFVLFDVLRRSVDVVLDSDLIQNLLGSG
jgi:hypothetical protein